MVEPAVLNTILLAWFAILALAEVASARRREVDDPTGDRRLITNFGLTIIALTVGSLVPIAKVEAAGLSNVLGFGMASRLGLPWIAALIVFLLIDSFATYWVHRFAHWAPLIWRLHRVHHADDQVDVSTSLRNHPFELAVVLPVSGAVVFLVGAPTSAVMVAQTVTVAAVIWQHADIRLPTSLDRFLSLLLVTPSLHRLHHSPDRSLHDSNFGELITLWDRIFGTFSQDRLRLRVGLDAQPVPPDRLLQQIWSPVYSA